MYPAVIVLQFEVGKGGRERQFEWYLRRVEDAFADVAPEDKPVVRLATREAAAKVASVFDTKAPPRV